MTLIPVMEAPPVPEQRGALERKSEGASFTLNAPNAQRSTTPTLYTCPWLFTPTSSQTSQANAQNAKWTWFRPAQCHTAKSLRRIGVNSRQARLLPPARPQDISTEP